MIPMPNEPDQAQENRGPGPLTRTIRFILTLPVVLYQKIISPALPPHCIYTPTCSQYTREAITRHGIRGLLAGILRLFRCVGGLYRGGEDPVPDELTAKYLFGSYRTFWNRKKDRPLQ
jgi:putative membrane protein insertion efficiency factor